MSFLQTNDLDLFCKVKKLQFSSSFAQKNITEAFP